MQAVGSPREDKGLPLTGLPWFCSMATAGTLLIDCITRQRRATGPELNMPRVLTAAALFAVALVAGPTTPAAAHDGPHEMADHCVTWSVTTLDQPSYLAPDRAEVEVEVANFCTYPVAASFCFRTRNEFDRDDIACRHSARHSDGGLLAPGQTWTEAHFQRRRPPRVNLQRGTAVYWW